MIIIKIKNKMMKYSLKIIFFENIFIFILLLKFCANTDCLSHSFHDLKYAKALTLENGYHLMITRTGIFTFYPSLNSFSYSYNFTDAQIMQDTLNSMEGTMNQVEISQFTGEEGGKRYVVCIANDYIYFMNEKGVVFNNFKITDLDASYTLSLLSYIYSDGNYFFVIAYNSGNLLMLRYYKIYKQNNKYEITLVKSNQFTPTIYGNIYSINPNGLSCQVMISSNDGKVLTCFESLKNDNKLAAFTFKPDNDNDNFDLLYTNTNFLGNFDNKEATFVKASLNNDKSKALVCYSVTNQDFVKCIYYDINTKLFNDLSLYTNVCNIQYFGFNIYYFDKTSEYILTCIGPNKDAFIFVRLNSDYSINGNNDDKSFNQNTFQYCTYYDLSSIIYVSKYKKYTAILNSECGGLTNVRVFTLTDSNCITLTPGEEELYPEATALTTIITTLPNIETTIPMPETTAPIIITTSPIIQTTIIETTTPETTIPKIITNFPEVETTIVYSTIINNIPETSIPISITTFPNIITTTINNPPLFSTIPGIKKETNFFTEKLCEDNKIYFEGKCICDKNKGYYSINYNEFNNECYKLEDLPKNIYCNNKTHSCEFCYKSCGTCNKGGDLSENNCLTCALDYVKEKEDDETSNCVEKCNYLFYYNSFNQYSCTEDEQCPQEASLIVRNKDKCTSKCLNEGPNIYQYNGECISSCPENTFSNIYYICQIKNTAICSTSEFKLNLEENIAQENVKLVAKNYATEFQYTLNHISKFTSTNFTMILYKNSSCIDELKLNITKIKYDSCIQQLKKDNNIDENKDLIIAVIDIVNLNQSFTSFGFFHPETGEKLDAIKSCSDKNVTMYEDLLSLLNDPLALQLLEDQKINIFDLNDAFYKDICFHFNSPNGKDATLQDRMKAFYPNATLCDAGCKNKGINLTTMKAECECTFQDLLSKNIYENDLFGNNIIIKESLQEITDMLNNLNVEVLTCYKDVFRYEYFKKNKSGFIIIALFILYTICIIYYYTITKNETTRYIYNLTEKYILHIAKNIPKSLPKFKNKKIKRKMTYCPVKKKIKNSNIDNKSKDKMEDNNTNKLKEKIKDKSKDKINIKRKDKEKSKTKIIGKNYNNKGSNRKNRENKTNIYKLKKTKKSQSSRKINFKQINILNFNIKSLKNIKGKRNQSKENNSIKKTSRSRSSSRLTNYNNTKVQFINNKIKEKGEIINKSFRPDFLSNKNDNFNVDIKEFLEPSLDNMDYDDIIDLDKRKFCQYYCEKIKDNHIIINSFFIQEIIKRRAIKIAIFIVTIDIYILTNGLFFSDSYISEIFNSTEKETIFSFIPRSIDRFLYVTIVGNIIEIILTFFFVEEIKIKQIFLRNKDNSLNIRFEIAELIKDIFKKIKILIIISYIVIIFSWYYLSCFNNVYPNLNNEWIISSIFIIIIMLILPFIITFLETSIRFTSIQMESEKLFKLSLLLA